MPKRDVLTKAEFDRLLRWLNSEDREQAGEKYEAIRRTLIQIFVWRGFSDAEGLADQTINRVARKVEDLADSYEGDPARYFYGVARMVMMEALKSHSQPVSLNEIRSLPYKTDVGGSVDSLALEREALDVREALERCINKLTEHDQKLFLDYYQFDKQAKIAGRKALAEEFGMSMNTLRVHIYRIRVSLAMCIRGELARLHGREGEGFDGEFRARE